MFAFLAQVKIRKKLKSNDKDNGPTSPTIPSITYDSVFDNGRELSADVYSTVGTGTEKETNYNTKAFKYPLMDKQICCHIVRSLFMLTC